MELVQLTRSTGHYHFPTAALSPVGALPSIDGAMLTGLAEAFASSDAYQVDRCQHAALCVLAADAGYLAVEDLAAFGERPSLKALHALTKKSVLGLGKAFRFGHKNLFRNRHRLHTTLSMKEASKETTAELAIGLIQAGVLDAASLYTTVKKGDYTVPIVAEKVNSCLKNTSGLTADAQYTCGTDIFIDGNEVKIEADQPTYYDFNLQSIPEEFRRELSILLQKAVAAITLHVIPIHVPTTFCGPYSYIGDELYGTLDEVGNMTADFSIENLAEVIKKIGFDNLTFEPYFLGLEYDEETGSFEENSLIHACGVLAQAHDMRENYSHWLGGDNENKIPPLTELAELAYEAKALAASGKPTSAAGEPLANIFEFVRRVVESGHTFHYQDWSGNFEDGYGLFETFVVRIDEAEHSDVYAEAYSYVDCVMNEQGYTYLSVPIERDVVARQLVPIMGYIKEVHSHLRNVESVIEEIANAF